PRGPPPPRPLPTVQEVEVCDGAGRALPQERVRPVRRVCPEAGAGGRGNPPRVVTVYYRVYYFRLPVARKRPWRDSETNCKYRRARDSAYLSKVPQQRWTRVPIEGLVG